MATWWGRSANSVRWKRLKSLSLEGDAIAWLASLNAEVDGKLWSGCNKSCKTILYCTLFIPCKYIMPSSHATCVSEIIIIQKTHLRLYIFQFTLSGLDTWIRQFRLEPFRMMAVILSPWRLCRALTKLDLHRFPQFLIRRKEERRRDCMAAGW